MTTVQTVAPQPGVVIQVSVSAVVNANEKRLVHCKRVLFGLGVTEFFLGLFSTLLGIIGFAFTFDDRVSSYFYLRTLNIGQGLWCGVWVGICTRYVNNGPRRTEILVAGFLGILNGRKSATQSLINGHMAMSIIASFFSAVMLAIAFPIAMRLWFSSGSVFLANMEIVLAVFGFTFILCIVSATYSCYTLSAAGYVSCCGNDCDCCAYNNQPRPEGQAVYLLQTANPNLQAMNPNLQAMNPNQQFFQANAVMVPGPGQVQTVEVSTSGNPQQNAYSATQSKEAESKALIQDGATENALLSA